jgi:hypothetical protein
MSMSLLWPAALQDNTFTRSYCGRRFATQRAPSADGRPAPRSAERWHSNGDTWKPLTTPRHVPRPLLTPRLLQLYVCLSMLELSAGRLFGIDTWWKPYRVAAVLVVVVASIEVPYGMLDWYDIGFLAVFLTGCGLSFIWLLLGLTEPVYVLRQCVFVLIPFSMYLCMKVGINSPEQLAALVRALRLGALINASYVVYEVFALGHTSRLAGLSGLAPELALHSGLALAFVLYPYPGRCRSNYFAVLVRVGLGAVLCFSVVVSGTRAAWVGLVVSTLVLACLMALSRSQRTQLLKCVTVLALVVCGAAAVSEDLLFRVGGDGLEKAILDRLASNVGLRTGSGRVEIWTNALNAMSQYYYVGGGFSGFRQATSRDIADFRTVRQVDIEHGVVAHNVFLELLTDYGPVSVLCFAVCLITLTKTLSKNVRNAGEELSGHGMLYSLLFLTVCGLFQDMMGVQDFWIIMAFVTLFVRYHCCAAPCRVPVRPPWLGHRRLWNPLESRLRTLPMSANGRAE